MSGINDYLFGNRALHEQWRGSTQVLVAMAEAAPRRMSIGQLCFATGRQQREVAKLCRGLENAGLLQPASKRNEWQLTCDANVLTLETVYLCVLDEAARQAKLRDAGVDAPDVAMHRVDLMLTQAVMTVHQSALAHLRQFSIGTIRRRESRESRELLGRSRWGTAETCIAYS